MSKSSSIVNLSQTFITQVISSLLGMIFLSILSRDLSKESLGVYMVIRRIAAFGIPIITLNLGLSLTRYSSYNLEKSEKYLISTLWILFYIIFLLSFLTYIFQTKITIWIFGNVKFQQLITPLLLFLISSSIQVICYNYFRGKQQFNKMNFVNLIFWVIALVVLFTVYQTDLLDIKLIQIFFMLYSLLLILFNLLFLFIYNNNRMFYGMLIKGWRLKNISNFVKYGSTRVLSGIFLSSIFMIPTVIAPLELAASIGLVVVVVRMLQMIGYPFNVIFLPKFSHFKSTDNQEAITNYSNIVLEYIFSVLLLLGLIIFYFTPELFTLFFGEKYTSMIKSFQIISPVLGLFLGYILIRGILDGLFKKAYVNIITASGALITLLSCLFVKYFLVNESGFIISFGIGVAVLGIVALFIFIKKLRLNILTNNILIAIVINSIALFIFALADKNIHSSTIFISLLIKVGISGIIVVSSIYIYYKMQFRWLTDITSKFSIGRQS